MLHVLKQYSSMLLSLIRGGGEAAARRRLAKKQASRILSELRILKFTARTKKGGVQTVRFEQPLLMTRDELWCPIDLKHRPAGVDTNMFRDENVLKSLEDRCHAAVRIDTLVSGKLCYVVRLAGNTFPETFGYNIFKMAPSAPPLAFPLGLNGNGEHAWADLARLPHLLLVGSTGKGKSNFIHQLLATWISRNSADDIQIWLADHKGGVELDRYKVLMGTKSQPGIVRRFSHKPEMTLELLGAAQTEMERRLELLRQAGASDLADYRSQTGQHLPPIAIVIDEIFFLMLNKEKVEGKFTVSQWAENLFSRIASAGRAPGIHLVIATQKTGKDVLTSLITANFESRIVFATSDMYQSIYVIGNSMAVGLPKGRMIFRAEGGETTEVQTPRITPDQTRLLINRVGRYGPDGGLGRRDELRRFLDDAKLIILAASEQLNGDLARSRVLALDGIRGVISRDRFDEVVGRLEKDGVVEGGGPRRMKRISKSCYGRPHLLDALYATDATDVAGSSVPTQRHPSAGQRSSGMSGENLGFTHQDEEEDEGANWHDLGSGMAISVDHVPSEGAGDSRVLVVRPS